MSEKQFSMGQVLSVTKDRLMCPIGDVYEILNYMTGESLMTHQLPRVAGEAKPVLIARHPWLEQIDLSDVDRDNWQQRLAEIIAEFGDVVAVPKLTVDQHESIDPLSELSEKIHPDRILVVKP